jgi:hypothetical protein
MDKEQTFKELRTARELFGKKSFYDNEENYHNLIFGLGYVLVHCPEELCSMVTATILETERRWELSLIYR